MWSRAGRVRKSLRLNRWSVNYAVLDAYKAGGGEVEVHMLEGCAHGPHFDCAERWNELFFGFLARN